MSAQGNRRPSWEILTDLFKAVGHKQVAYQLHLNQSLIYDWAKEPESPEEMMNSGRRNPLDRTRELIHLAVTGGRKDVAVEIINWFAAELSGVYIGDDQIAGMKAIIATIEDRANPKAIRRLK